MELAYLWCSRIKKSEFTVFSSMQRKDCNWNETNIVLFMSVVSFTPNKTQRKFTYLKGGLWRKNNKLNVKSTIYRPLKSLLPV